MTDDSATKEPGSVGTDDDPSRSDDDALRRRSLFRVVAGAPDDTELAALAAVVAAAAGAEDDDAPSRAPDLWSDPAAQLRAPLHAGPGAWRASGLPR